MHALQLLHKTFSKALPTLHLARLSALLAAVDGLLLGRELWLTGVGRHLRGKALEKHKIKRIDRLLGNTALHHERASIYACLSRLLIGGCRHPSIIVDWSDIDPNKTLFLLRAAVSVGGRALPIYEEVHSRYHHAHDTKAFLDHLAAVLPTDCVPIIVTDAGFRGPWFKAVEALGWFYVGRVRNRDYARFPAEQDWFPAKNLYTRATATPRALGAIELARSAPLSTRAYVYRKPARGRQQRTVRGERRRNSASEKHAAREREPWLLISNLPEQHHIAKRVIAIYRDRMTIEQAFRDLKAPRYGLAFRYNLGRRAERVANLLLIGAIATLVTWLTGLAGIARGLARTLQANTEKRRAVLSIFFIGTRLIKQRLRITPTEIHSALEQLRATIVHKNYEIV
jgi:hypothetical protein